MTRSSSCCPSSPWYLLHLPPLLLQRQRRRTDSEDQTVPRAAVEAAAAAVVVRPAWRGRRPPLRSHHTATRPILLALLCRTRRRLIRKRGLAPARRREPRPRLQLQRLPRLQPRPRRPSLPQRPAPAPHQPDSRLRARPWRKRKRFAVPACDVPCVLCRVSCRVTLALTPSNVVPHSTPGLP
jgi:hypothetical protein